MKTKPVRASKLQPGDVFIHGPLVGQLKVKRVTRIGDEVLIESNLIETRRDVDEIVHVVTT